MAVNHNMIGNHILMFSFYLLFKRDNMLFQYKDAYKALTCSASYPSYPICSLSLCRTHTHKHFDNGPSVNSTAFKTDAHQN